MITSFKAGAGVEKDSIKLEVVQRKDFLNIDWDERLDTLMTSIENDQENHLLNLTYSGKKHPYATLTYSPFNTKSMETFYERQDGSRAFMSNYMRDLYGSSKYKYDGDDIMLSSLFNNYNERFKNPLLSMEHRVQVPLEIWETKTSYIALVGERNTHDAPASYHYFVIAEPKSSNK